MCLCFQRDAARPRDEEQAHLQPHQLQPRGPHGTRRRDAGPHGPPSGNSSARTSSSCRHVLLPHLLPPSSPTALFITLTPPLFSPPLPPPVSLPSPPLLPPDVQVCDVTSLTPSPSPSPSSSSSRHTLISPPSNFEHVYHMTSASAGAFLQKDASSSSSSQQSLLQPSSSSSSPSTSSLGRVGQLLSIALTLSPSSPTLPHSSLACLQCHKLRTPEMLRGPECSISQQLIRN